MLNSLEIFQNNSIDPDNCKESMDVFSKNDKLICNLQNFAKCTIILSLQ